MGTPREIRSKKILMVAGEVSGDLHGAHLMESIRSIDPGVRFFGVGGQGMERMGMKILFSSQSLSVVGITEVFFRLGTILRVLRGLKEFLDRERPDLVILIDYPDFNFRVARIAHERKIPILYYISPQVWAWRSGRVRQIRRWVKKMVVFFPFEVPIYERAGVDVAWVGHPLIDIVKPTLSKEEAWERFGLDPGKRLVGLLPGSRTHEVRRLLPALLGAAARLKERIPGIQFAIPRAPGIPAEAFTGWMKEASVSARIVEGCPYDVMNLSDLLVIASGTATLEGAILGKPMVIVYKVSALSYWIGRVLISVDHIGLVNLVGEERIAPELIQKDANPEKIAHEAFQILNDPVRYREMSGAMDRVRQRLGEPGAAERAARIVCALLAEGGN
jgi:lipid-A-disaccharide synthase